MLRGLSKRRAANAMKLVNDRGERTHRLDLPSANTQVDRKPFSNFRESTSQPVKGIGCFSAATSKVERWEDAT